MFLVYFDVYIYVCVCVYVCVCMHLGRETFLSGSQRARFCYKIVFFALSARNFDDLHPAFNNYDNYIGSVCLIVHAAA
jgi:hypothetical protein